MIGALLVLGLLGALLAVDTAVRHRHRICRWLDRELFLTVCGCVAPRPADPTVLSRCRTCGHLWAPDLSPPPEEQPS